MLLRLPSLHVCEVGHPSHCSHASRHTISPWPRIKRGHRNPVQCVPRFNYLLKAAPVEIKQESTGGKIARCLFASCAGIEDKGNVSVQYIELSSSKMLWAYSVNKQRGGSKNQQSMAEAVAKHLKEFIEHK